MALPPATMIVLLAAALLVLLTPLWVHSALDLAGGSVSGGDRAAAHVASDETVAHLLAGGDFSVAAPDGTPLYTADEIGHMRDVRVVLYGFGAFSVVSAAIVGYAMVRRSKDVATWRGIGRGSVLLVGVLVVLAVIGVLAFGVAFELFHRILFPGGNWAFPEDSNLIRLYPYAFWQLSSGALAVIAVVGAVLLRIYASRQLRKQIWT